MWTAPIFFGNLAPHWHTCTHSRHMIIRPVAILCCAFNSGPYSILPSFPLGNDAIASHDKDILRAANFARWFLHLNLAPRLICLFCMLILILLQRPFNRECERNKANITFMLTSHATQDYHARRNLGIFGRCIHCKGYPNMLSKTVVYYNIDLHSNDNACGYNNTQ
jgi:hypothetical protein